jgi:hypothetical protein
MEESIDSDDVKSLLDQLKDTTSIARKVEKAPFTLPKEDLENFILNNTGRLIKDSMETIDSIKEFIISAPEPEDVHSLAELYKASTSAIEALNKILLQQQKAETQLTVKTMDIQSKQALAEKRDDKSTFTREEIMEQLFESGKLIDADINDTDDQS